MHTDQEEDQLAFVLGWLRLPRDISLVGGADTTMTTDLILQFSAPS